MGYGSLPDLVPIQIQVGFTPIWLVAASMEDGTVWAATSEQGEVSAYLVQSAEIRKLPLEVGDYAPGQPPLLQVGPEGISLVSVRDQENSVTNHPVRIISSEGLAWVDIQGQLHLQTVSEHLLLEVDALPDGRILQDELGRLLLLTGPTDRYDHGVLGDGLEAAGVTLVETTPEFRIVKRLEIPESLVIEGIMALWDDLNDDGEREIIVTASDRNTGARILVYSERGELLAESDPIGQGYRWRHQIAVTDSFEKNMNEIVSVRTPHIGGLLEYFRLQGNKLEVAATLEGVTSHVIGTRNLDLALVGDFDGDGTLETLLPDNDRELLVAVERTVDGAKLDWTLSLEGTLSSNLAAVTDDEGRISVGVGLSDGSVLVWSHN
jgi:hypothetical protein